MSNSIDYKAAYERQKQARARAEDILENKSRELYEKNRSLLDAYNKLKDQKAQLLHQEKLASIGQLSAGVAHEINNPTGFVKSNTNTLKHYIASFKILLATYDSLFKTLEGQGTVPEDMQTHLQNMREELDIDYLVDDIDDLIKESLSGLARIEDIVKSLKSFARPDENKSSQYDLNECIENTLKLVWNEIKYKVELKTELESLPKIYGYPGELSQVILNLLVNAAHAIDETGEIAIKTKANEFSILLSVTDNGCGIEEDHMEHLFDPFFTTKDVDMGTGLGLSICHSIIKKHEGSIHVDSKVDEGTRFTIELPIRNTPFETQSV